jgi:ADAM-TS Spacer 1
MDDENQYFLNGNRVIDWPGVYKAAGDVFSYDRSKDFESISTNGPLNKDVIVTVLVIYV